MSEIERRLGHSKLVWDKGAQALKTVDPNPQQPRVIDFDDGEISVRFNGEEIRGWSYKDDAERRIKMLCAREYVEGWCDGREAKQ